MSSSETARFIVLGMQRSGTTATQHMIVGHPEIDGQRREVSVEFYSRGESIFYYGDAVQPRGVEAYRALFDAIALSGRSVKGLAAWGIKTALGHENQAHAVVERLQTSLPGVRVIFVHRRDPLAALASWERAKQTDQWHVQSANDLKNNSDTRIDIKKGRLTEYIIDWWGVNSTIRNLHSTHSVYEIEYEKNMIEMELGDNSSLFSFLGAKSMAAKWLQHKKVAPPVHDYVNNYQQLADWRDEVCSELERGVPYRELLDEYGPSAFETSIRFAKRVAKHPGSLSPKFWGPRVQRFITGS